MLATISRSCWPWEGDGPVLVLLVRVGPAPRKAKGAGEELKGGVEALLHPARVD